MNDWKKRKEKRKKKKNNKEKKSMVKKKLILSSFSLPVICISNPQSSPFQSNKNKVFPYKDN